MDRRKEDRGGRLLENYIFSDLNQYVDKESIYSVDRRSGQDRRKHDLLAEARDELSNPVSTVAGVSFRVVYKVLRILITVMDRRGK